MSKASVFRRASEAFNEGVARSQPSWNELGDRAWAAILNENKAIDKPLVISLRCRGAGWADE